MAITEQPESEGRSYRSGRRERHKTESMAIARPVSGASAASGSPRPERRVADDLKGKTARGALISVLSQGTNFVLRMGSMMILARILGPRDFGLVGMVTACTDVLSL